MRCERHLSASRVTCVRAVVATDASVRVIGMLAAVELAVRRVRGRVRRVRGVPVGGVRTRQELRVHVVRPLREQRPRACPARTYPRTRGIPGDQEARGRQGHCPTPRKPEDSKECQRPQPHEKEQGMRMQMGVGTYHPTPRKYQIKFKCASKMLRNSTQSTRGRGFKGGGTH